MHSLESLREIRELEFYFGGRDAQARAYDRMRRAPVPSCDGKVAGVLKYDLRTGEISVVRV